MLVLHLDNGFQCQDSSNWLCQTWWGMFQILTFPYCWCLMSTIHYHTEACESLQVSTSLNTCLSNSLQVSVLNSYLITTESIFYEHCLQFDSSELNNNPYIQYWTNRPWNKGVPYRYLKSRNAKPLSNVHLMHMADKFPIVLCH